MVSRAGLESVNSEDFYTRVVAGPLLSEVVDLAVAEFERHYGQTEVPIVPINIIVAATVDRIFARAFPLTTAAQKRQLVERLLEDIDTSGFGERPPRQQSQ